MGKIKGFILAITIPDNIKLIGLIIVQNVDNVPNI